jgi:hypothetical protein
MGGRGASHDAKCALRNARSHLAQVERRVKDLSVDRSTAGRLESTTRSLTGSPVPLRRPTALSKALGPASLVLSGVLLLVTLGSTARSQTPTEKVAPPEKQKSDSTPPKNDGFAKDDEPEKKGAEKAKPDENEDDIKPTTQEDREALPRGVFVPPPKPA